MSADGHEHLDTMRHSAAHVMAKAVQRLFPGTRLAIGPTIENGFYYDFDSPHPMGEADLERIEEEMARIIAAGEPFERIEMTRAHAIRHYTEVEPNLLKVEVLQGIADDTVSFYRTGDDWMDLCRGPHLPSARDIAAFKLTSVAGAYWRGDERNAMLQRVYGTAWPTREALDDYLHRLEEAQRRDHRKLGRELDLFSTHEEAGPGLIYWHPKGGRVRHLIEEYWRKQHLSGGYEIVYSPHIGRSWLWETSGHLDFFAENMYAPMEVDDRQYYLKPMNCPFHIMMYKTRLRSYRELPMRWAELGTVYRYERSGVLHGLARVRGFTQDDAHIFCRPEQVEDEIEHALNFSMDMLAAFGFDQFDAYLSTRPEKAVGPQENWELATNALERALKRRGVSFEVDEGGGAFYGPKIDLKIRDALGRSWQCSTIQFDFNLPERFDLAYIGEDGAEHRPYMVHRALLGSIERFFAVLIEHYGGAFPLWLAPVQAVVIPIADRHNDYAESVAAALRAGGIERVEVDTRSERMNAKIRDAQLQKAPYMLIAGDREVEAMAVSVRARSGDEEKGVPLADCVTRLAAEAAERR